MFDISNAGRSGAEGDGAEEVGTERASKRMKLTMGEETLPEIQMEETSTILDAMIPFFYIADEADYDTDHLGTIGEPEQLPSWARFFDKFNLSVGIASLVVYLPSVSPAQIAQKRGTELFYAVRRSQSSRPPRLAGPKSISWGTR